MKAQSPRPKRRGNVHEFSPGVKISVQIGEDVSDERLQFVKQLGVGWVNINTKGAGATAESMIRFKSKVESAGLKVWNIGNSDVHNMEAVTLNLAGRDQKVEEYKQYLRNLGKAGIYYTTYAHMGNGIWSTERELTRGGSSARAFNLAKADKGYWAGKEYAMPLTHGRRFTEKEIWDNYTHFITQAATVAEETGVRMGIHPDDPPVKELGGVPRCIFSSFEGYKRALDIADSDNVGVCLCCGCWLEGGPAMGADVVDAIKYFAGRNKLWKIHFRNVDKPLPHFKETFMNDGYESMYRIMKALVEVDFKGNVIADHIPQMVGGHYAGTAYQIGYMQGLLERAEAEVKAKRRG